MAVPVDVRVRIASAADGKVLDTGAGRVGGRVGPGWPGHGEQGQWWRLAPVPGRHHRFHLVQVDSGLVVAGVGHPDRGEVRLTAEPEDPRAVWWVLSTANDEYWIVNEVSDLGLELGDGSGDDEAHIGLVKHQNNARQRWRLVTDRTPGGTRAVVTMVYNEDVMLPLWLRYYSRFFAPEDIYVLDHDSTDGSTDGPGFTRVPAHNTHWSGSWQRDVCQQFQHELLRRYDVVLQTDVDEIVAPDPRCCDLGEYIDRFDGDFVTCTGYEVLHLRDREPGLDLDRPVLNQRGTWFFNERYGKPLLARIPMYWSGGFHRREDGVARHDPLLRLIHLHRMDRDLGLARHRIKNTRKRVQREIDRNYAPGNRITDPDEFDRWFSTDRVENLEEIPPHWKDVV
ncbi:hypothetical protein ADK67_19390 [Saccharothrix sp. NRRL B-16348]|uniref:RICIN domain-containing protein n=1 Tax=Saccharothrix sp. NRRL B-16348 TaxID=1415542 RepID=UPI0006AE9303|nr:RICIN domain-containing protein [Saccharothrix sp. NRRL B-16348]KOX23946.1 hypothetical protein ADK67_19390 [Saccharothrix sp. NRRL B-16348]